MASTYNRTRATYARQLSVFNALRYYVSAVFAVARCLSANLSVTFVYCIHMTNKAIVRQASFSARYSSIILVFDRERGYQFINRDSFSGGAKYTVVGKICDFRLKSPFISEAVRDRPMVAM